MSLMIPAGSSSARSLTDVLPDVVAALTGGTSPLPAASSAVVFVVDGKTVRATSFLPMCGASTRA